VGHEPLAYPNKGYGPFKKKSCNEYLKLGFSHRSTNRNVCKAYQPFRNVRVKPINHLNHIHRPVRSSRTPVQEPMISAVAVVRQLKSHVNFYLVYTIRNDMLSAGKAVGVFIFFSFTQNIEKNCRKFLAISSDLQTRCQAILRNSEWQRLLVLAA